jgi:hypothetical protein
VPYNEGTLYDRTKWGFCDDEAEVFWR